MKRLVPALAVLVLLAGTVPASAHPAPFSYLDVVLSDGGVDVGLVAHNHDLAHELQIDPVERLLDPSVVASQTSRIVSLVLSRLRVEANGRPAACRTTAPPEILTEPNSPRR